MLKGEALRRGIHLTGIVIPLAYYFGSWSRTTIISVLSFIFLLFLLADLCRLIFPALNERITSHLPGLIKTEEKRLLLGSTYFILGALLACVLFEKEVTIAILFFLVLGDQAASFVGKKFGRHRIMGKTWEGTFACGLVCFVVSLQILPLIASLVASITAALSELFLARYVDDNLVMPMVSGVATSLVLYFQ